MNQNLLGKWEATEMVHPIMNYNFSPEEWMLEFRPDGKMVIYLEGDPVTTKDYTLDGYTLTIGDIVSKFIEISDSEMTILETFPIRHTIYRRVSSEPKSV